MNLTKIQADVLAKMRDGMDLRNDSYGFHLCDSHGVFFEDVNTNVARVLIRKSTVERSGSWIVQLYKITQSGLDALAQYEAREKP